MKHFAFDAGKTQNRQIDENDDRLSVNRWPAHFDGGGDHGVEAFVIGERSAQCMMAFGQAAQTVLRDDNRAIGDQAEIKRAQAHQIGADLAEIHADCQTQHRHRDDCRRHQRGAEIAEHDKQHENDQRSAFEQIFRHRLDGGFHKQGPVQDRAHLDARRQRFFDLLHARVDSFRNRSAVGADQHQRGADHHFFAIHAGAADTQLLANADRGDVADTHRHAIARRRDDFADVVEVFEAPAAAHDQPFAITFDIAGAAADVVFCNRAGEIIKGKAQRRQLRGVWLNMIFLDEAAQRVDAGDARHGAQLRTNDPVLHGAQIGLFLHLRRQQSAFRRQIGAVSLPAGFAIMRRPFLWLLVAHRPHVDFRQAGGDWPHPDFNQRREILACLIHALRDLLTREINIDAISKDDRDLREAIARQ